MFLIYVMLSKTKLSKSSKYHLLRHAGLCQKMTVKSSWNMHHLKISNSEKKFKINC